MEKEETRSPEELIRAAADPVIYQRGVDYLVADRVLSLNHIADNSIEGTVAGNGENYTTRVHFRGDEVITDCTCPYDWTSICKHAVALALAYDEELDLLPDLDIDEFPDAPPAPEWLTTMRLLDGDGAAISAYTHAAYIYRLSLPPGPETGLVVQAHRLTPIYTGLGTEDSAIMNLLRPPNLTFPGDMFVDGDVADPVLRLLATRPNVYVGDAETPARIDLDPVAVRTKLAKDGEDHLLTLVFEDEYWRERDGRRVLGRRSPWVTDGVRFAPLQTKLDGAALSHLSKAPNCISAVDFPYFVGHFLDSLVAKANPVMETDAVPEIREDIQPRPIITLKETVSGVDVSLSFAYGDGPPQASPGNEATLVGAALADKAVLARRNREAEAQTVAMLKGHGLALEAGTGFLTNEAAVEFLAYELPKLRRGGCEIVGEVKRWRFSRRKPKPRAAVRTGIDWFDLDISFDYGGTSAQVSEVLAAYRSGRRVVKLEDGSWGGLPVEWLRKLSKPLAELEQRSTITGTDDRSATLDEPRNAWPDNNGAGFRMRRFDAPLIDEILVEIEEVESDTDWRRLSADSRNFSGLQPPKMPPGLHGELRDYQAHGLAWLNFLNRFGFAGILADDMGLGKTIQAIALLLTEYRQKGVRNPSLIVTPTSVAFNWAAELSRFAPDLKVIRLTGPGRRELFDRIDQADVAITTYPLLWRDLELLARTRFHYVILDEAQFIKNAATRTAKAAGALSAANRLALTGTPMENHLGELWSIFDFLMPGFLGPYRDFQQRYEGPVARQDVQTLRLLTQRLRPFILRRTKDEVAKELPPKTETVTYCEMTPAQATLYRQLLNTYRAQVMEVVDQRGIQRSQISILDALMKLRQVCCHPRLLKIAGNRVDSSGKMDVWCRMIVELIEEGHRALVFSQFTKMLKLLKDWLDARGIKYEYLDGRTRHREQAVANFNNGDAPLFLISLKAGGSGLNLTAADYVIHYDPWWNPAVENQATDRAHRIGQEKHVFAYKLITKNSIEEKVLELQEHKRALVDNIIGGVGKGRGLTREDLDFLFE